MQYSYFAELTRDPDGGFLATFPDVPEAIAHGATRELALYQAALALSQGLRTYFERKLRLPIPVARSGTPVHLAAHDAMKLAVMDAFLAADITKSELAARLGKHEGEARRILDPDHATKLPLLEAALAVLGRKAVVLVEEAA